MNIEEIKVFRLKSGEDIIGFISDIDDSKFNVRYPMLIDISPTASGHSSFVIQSWLPHQLYKFNEVNIWQNDVLFMSDVTDSFIEYYNDMVDKLERYITASEIMDHLESEEEMMEAIQEKETSVIH